MMRRGFQGSLLLAGILTLWAASASAQAIGSIFGKVTDDSGAVLPGVTVTVNGPTLQQPLVAVTTGTGAYQFPNVPIGKFTVTFEMGGFKKVTRPDVVIESGFNAGIDAKLELGAFDGRSDRLGRVAHRRPEARRRPGAVFTADVLEKIPSARDPWQIIGMTPGVRAGLNVGGSTSGQQVALNSRGTAANVQWNLEGGSITDLSSNSSPSYFNFDSLEQIQVSNGGGDVSVQSSGLAINLVTKSGSNVFKGTCDGHATRTTSMQASNVTQELFSAGSNGFLSGNADPEDRRLLGRIRRPHPQGPALVLGIDGLPGHQCRRRELLRREQGAVLLGPRCGAAGEPADKCDHLRQPRPGRGLPQQRHDDDQEHAVEDQLSAQLGPQGPVSLPERQQVSQPA